MALAVSKAGGRLLMSCEGDWWHAPPWFDPDDPAALRRLESVAQAADTLVVPSRRLGESVGARFHRPVAVIPPTVPPLADLPRARARSGRGLRVGWVGSGTHLGDLELIGPAVLDLLARCPDVTFVFGSSFVPAWARVHPRIERQYVGGMVSLMNYYRWLAALLRLVDDADLRAHLSARGHAWAATRTIDATGPLWATLWGAA